MSSSVNWVKTGKLVGTGADKKVVLGFKPRHVKIFNVTQLRTVEKSDTMAAAKAFNEVTAGTKTYADLVVLESDGFTLKAAAHASADEVHYYATEGRND